MIGELDPRPPQRDPIGRDELAEGFRSLGLKRGQDLLIHCSLRQVGRIDGGAATLLTAILDLTGPNATLVVPTQTTENSLTSSAFLSATAGLDEEERARFVAAMPGFDAASTPSTGMGAFAEYVRTRPSASRSSHPQVSFAAIGPRAHACTSVHDLDCHLGDRSPLGWLYEANAAILLLGVGYSACTAFHLAEYHLPSAPRRRYHCFTAEGKLRVEHEFTDIDLDDRDFELLGAELESTAEQNTSSGPRRGQIGSAACRLVPLRLAVDFARTWLPVHRGQGHLMTKQHQCFLSSQPTPTMEPAPVGWEVGRGVPDDNEYGSPFFLSYARAMKGPAVAGKARDPDRYVKKFFHDLAENVGQLIALRADVPAGFMDQEIRGGVKWPDALMRAVGTCQVLVALLSPLYVESDWCGMEWHAFSQREVLRLERTNVSPDQGCIVPVIWTPVPSALPGQISTKEIFSPTNDLYSRTPIHYEQNGIFGLMRTRLRNSYEIVTWQLAMHIAHIYHSQRTEARNFELAELRNIFRSDSHGC